jgi:chromate transport protein ChrA
LAFSIALFQFLVLTKYSATLQLFGALRFGVKITFVILMINHLWLMSERRNQNKAFRLIRAIAETAKS